MGRWMLTTTMLIVLATTPVTTLSRAPPDRTPWSPSFRT